MPTRSFLLHAAAGALSTAALARAQPVQAPAPPVLTVDSDRPGFYEGTGTVPPFHVQLESGVTFTNDSDDEAWALPQATLRLGLTDWGEVFVDLPSWNSADRDGGGRDEGVGDTTLGFKARFWDQDGARPAVALVGELTIPTGNDPFTSDSVATRVLGAASWDLAGLGAPWEGLSLHANLALAFPTDGDDRFIEGQHAVALSVPLADRLGTFVEYYGFWRAHGGGPPEHYMDTGLTYLLTPRIQLDVNGGVGLNANADDWFIGAGIAVLF